MLDAKERLEEILKHTGLSYNSLAKAVGLKRSQNLYDIRDRKIKDISFQLATMIGATFPEFNALWLMEGEGPMLQKISKPPRLEANPLHLSAASDEYNNEGSRFEELPDGTLRMRVPIIPHKAYAGYLRGFQDAEFYEGLESISIDVYKQHKGHYLAFEVNGDSMTTLEPELFKQSIFDGSIAIGRELSRHLWQYKLHMHNYDAWVIVHKTEGILTKQIIDHDVDNGYITIHSLNPDKEQYPDEKLFLDDIEQIFNIVQVVSKR